MTILQVLTPPLLEMNFHLFFIFITYFDSFPFMRKTSKRNSIRIKGIIQDYFICCRENTVKKIFLKPSLTCHS